MKLNISDETSIVVSNLFIPTWHTSSLVPPGYLPCKCHVSSTCWFTHCLHQPLPSWLTKLLHFIVPLQPFCCHWSQTITRPSTVLSMNTIQNSYRQSQSNANALPVCRDWGELTLHIKKIIFIWKRVAYQCLHSTGNYTIEECRILWRYNGNCDSLYWV